MVDLTHVLEEKFKGMEWSLVGDCTTEEQFKNGFTITKANGFEEPTWAKLQEHLTSMQAEYDALDYSRKRKTAYDELNQYELMYDDKVNSTDKWGEAITAIKNKFPKG
jgi:hypothetical protein|tara:strand:+ start:2640 stop:2963 length:324 start_codon:yes stop_codon:yes gene_type:complete